MLFTRSNVCQWPNDTKLSHLDQQQQQHRHTINFGYRSFNNCHSVLIRYLLIKMQLKDIVFQTPSVRPVTLSHIHISFSGSYFLHFLFLTFTIFTCSFTLCFGFCGAGPINLRWRSIVPIHYIETFISTEGENARKIKQFYTSILLQPVCLGFARFLTAPPPNLTYIWDVIVIFFI